RYQGTEHETAFQIKRVAFEIEPEFGEAGFGAVPKKWNWSNVPREVLGEGVVVRTAPNAASVLVTYSLHEVLAGDYVELESPGFTGALAGSRKSASLKTCAVKASTWVSGSFHASRPSPAFVHVSSKN